MKHHRSEFNFLKRCLQISKATLFALLVALISSCTPETVVFVGETLSHDELRDMTFSESVTAESVADPTVYWTEGGSVWHKDIKCSSLSDSKDVLSGTVSDALAHGKERECKRCG